MSTGLKLKKHDRTAFIQLFKTIRSRLFRFVILNIMKIYISGKISGLSEKEYKYNFYE